MPDEGDSGPDANIDTSPDAGGLPVGTLTFVLTDIEGSTKLWDDDPVAMAAARQQHDALIADAVAAHGGSLVKSKGEGDSTLSVFLDPAAAVSAAEAMRHEIAAASWPTASPIRARIGVLTGVAELRDGDYYGAAINRAARVRSLAHGGEILLAASTYTLVADSLLRNRAIEDRGEHELRGLQRPERVYALAFGDAPPAALPPPGATRQARVQMIAGVGLLVLAALAALVGVGAVLAIHRTPRHKVAAAGPSVVTLKVPANLADTKPSVEISSVQLVSTPQLVRYEVSGVFSRVRIPPYQIRVLAKSPKASGTWLWSDPARIDADGRWTGALDVPIGPGGASPSLRVSAIAILAGPVRGASVSGPPGSSATAGTVANPALARYEHELATRGPTAPGVVAVSAPRGAN